MTWISPNSATKSEIDYIMTNRIDIFLDVSFINSFNTGSDNRMIRGRARSDTQFERVKMVAQPKKIDLQRSHQFHQKILTLGVTQLKMIDEAAISIAGRYKSVKPDKLLTGTKQLREKHTPKRGMAHQHTSNIPGSAKQFNKR